MDERARGPVARRQGGQRRTGRAGGHLPGRTARCPSGGGEVEHEQAAPWSWGSGRRLLAAAARCLEGLGYPDDRVPPSVARQEGVGAAPGRGQGQEGARRPRPAGDLRRHEVRQVASPVGRQREHEGAACGCRGELPGAAGHRERWAERVSGGRVEPVHRPLEGAGHEEGAAGTRRRAGRGGAGGQAGDRGRHRRQEVGESHAVTLGAGGATGIERLTHPPAVDKDGESPPGRRPPHPRA